MVISETRLMYYIYIYSYIYTPVHSLLSLQFWTKRHDIINNHTTPEVKPWANIIGIEYVLTCLSFISINCLIE